MKDSDRNRAIIAEVIARAWRDPAFRASLVRAPKQTLQQAGMTIAPETEVVIRENTADVIYAILPPKADMARFASRIPKAVQLLSDMPDTLEVRVLRDSARRSYIVLPAAPAAARSGELSDAQLEQVAGGKHGSAVATTALTVQTVVQATTTAVNAEGVTQVAVAVEGVVAPCFIS